MWNSFSTAGPLGITAEITTFAGGGGDQMHAYVARPTTPGPKGGVLLVAHMPGFDEFYLEFAERLARHGYIVICPDIYCRFGHGTPDDVAAKARSEGGVTDATIVADAAAAQEWLRAQPDHNGTIGVLGTCSGGRHALLAASSLPGFDAVVDLWGGGVVAKPEDLTPARPVAVVDLTPNLTAPLLGLFGNEDQHPTPELVDVHEAALQAAGKTYEFHRYDGAGHGFTYYYTPRYRAEAAMDAWNRIFDFFGTHLA